LTLVSRLHVFQNVSGIYFLLSCVIVCYRELSCSYLVVIGELSWAIFCYRTLSLVIAPLCT